MVKIFPITGMVRFFEVDDISILPALASTMGNGGAPEEFAVALIGGREAIPFQGGAKERLKGGRSKYGSGFGRVTVASTVWFGFTSRSDRVIVEMKAGINGVGGEGKNGSEGTMIDMQLDITQSCTRRHKTHVYRKMALQRSPFRR